MVDSHAGECILPVVNNSALQPRPAFCMTRVGSGASITGAGPASKLALRAYVSMVFDVVGTCIKTHYLGYHLT